MLQCDSPFCTCSGAWNPAGSSCPSWRLRPLTAPPHVCLGPQEPTESDPTPPCPKQRSDPPCTLWRSELDLVHSPFLRATGPCEEHRQKHKVDISLLVVIIYLSVHWLINWVVFISTQKVKNVRGHLWNTFNYKAMKHRKVKSLTFYLDEWL